MTQSATKLLHLLQRYHLRLFTTCDLVTLTSMKPSAATQALHRLAKQNLLTRIKRGTWMNRLVEDLNPYEAVPHLAAPWPAYVSLHSALADYGLVEEIPQLIYAVSAGRSRRYLTPIGAFRFHHLPQRLLWGYQFRRVGRCHYPVAEPEKAFLDLAYLALIPRSGLKFPTKRQRHWGLDSKKFRRYAVRFGFQPLWEWLKIQKLL